MNRKRVVVTLVVAVLALLVPLGAIALAPRQQGEGVPGQMTYQGYLTNAQGTPIAGDVDLQFGIYPQESGGDVEWSETHDSVELADGYFSVNLGETTPLTSTVFADPDRWLQVSVNGEAMGRQKIAAAPYAFQAERKPMVGCRVVATQTQSIASTTLTALDFQLAIEDMADCWSPEHPSQLFAPTDGYYMAGGEMTFGNAAITTDSRVSIMIYHKPSQESSGIYIQSNDVHAIANTVVAPSVTTGMFYMNAGDYIEIHAWHESTSSSIDTYIPPDPLKWQHCNNGWLLRID